MVSHYYFPSVLRKSMTTIVTPAAAACAEETHGGPSDVVVVKAAPKSRTMKTAETPKPSADIDDPLFFAKLNLMSKKIAQDARRCRLASLPIV